MSKYEGDGGGPVIRTNEVQDPTVLLADRMRQLGASDEIVDDTIQAIRQGRADLASTSDPELAAYIGARMSGTTEGFRQADLAAIAAARADTETWRQATDAVQGSIPGVIKWVGTDAGRAAVAHDAEIQAAQDAGRDPRSTLVRFLRGVHGQNDIGA